MDNLIDIRPKLKQDAVFLQSDEQVFFQADKGAFRLKGKSVAQWISVLGPYMTGEFTLDQLCQKLDPAHRDAVIRLVNTLLQKGVLKNEQPEAPELLPVAVRQQFRSQIEFIDHFVDHPQERFKTFRESRILLVGSGESYSSLAICLIRNGLRELFLAPVDRVGEYLEKLVPETQILHQHGCEVLVSPVNFSPPDLSLVNNGSKNAFDIIVFCADNQSIKDVFTLNQLCIGAERAFLPACVFAGQAMLGPYLKPLRGPCWLCSMMRLSANIDGDRSSALWRELTLGRELLNNEYTLFAPVARRIGNGLGFELFKILTGALPSETEGGIIFQDLETLESYHGKLLAHPLCPCCSHQDLDASIQQLQEVVAGTRDHSSTQAEFFQAFSQLVDPRIGLFHSYADYDIIQLPLKATKLIVGSPVSSISSSSEVAAYDIENVVNARQTALSIAVSKYTRALPDTRRMLSASFNEMRATGKEAIPAQELSTWSGNTPLTPDTRTEWFPVFSLLKQSICYVPAAAVYPHAPLNRLGLFERTLAGSAAQLTYRDTLSAGILSALGYECARDLIRRCYSSAELDLDTLQSIDADLTFLLRNAKRFERSFTMLKVLNELPLSVVIVFTSDTFADQISSVGSGLSSLEAAKKALLHFVGNLQFLQTEGKRPESIDELYLEFSPHVNYESIVYGQGEQNHSAANGFKKPEATIKQVEEYLFENGRDVLFAHTTTPDIWEMESLISGTVLLTRATNQDWR